MSLLIWLPLHGNLNNYGLAPLTFSLQGGSGIATSTGGKTNESCYARNTINTDARIESNDTLTLSNDSILKGSARSFKGAPLNEFFDMNKELFITSGGHAFAGGLSIKKEDIDILIDRFNEFVRRNFLRYLWQS